MTLKDIKWTFNTPNFFFLIFKLPVLPLLWSYIDEEMLWHQFWISSVRPYKANLLCITFAYVYLYPWGCNLFLSFYSIPFFLSFLWMYVHILFEKYGFKVMLIWNYERNWLLNIIQKRNKFKFNYDLKEIYRSF